MLAVADENPSRRDRTFFRIVKRKTPRYRELYSHAALYPRRAVPRGVDPASWHGVSVYADESDAVDRIRRQPKLGTYIARLNIPAAAPVRMRYSPTDGDSHWDLYARPGVLRRLVVSVRRVLSMDSARGPE